MDNVHGVGHDRTEYALISDIGNLENVLEVFLGVRHDRTKYVPVLAAWRICWT